MNTKPLLYLATSLTHVPESDRPEIVQLVDKLHGETRFLQWAFDPKTWTPRKVDNIYLFDTAMVRYADFVAGVYWSSAGSDGRGAELLLRASEMGGRGMRIYIREGVQITPFVTCMANHHGISIKSFKTVQELGSLIVNNALWSMQDESIKNPPWQLNRATDLGFYDSGNHAEISSLDAILDLKRLVGV